jgi:hypothetical protein
MRETSIPVVVFMKAIEYVVTGGPSGTSVKKFRAIARNLFRRQGEVALVSRRIDARVA